MILNNEADILKEVSKNKYNIYYIYGDENYLKRTYYNKILDVNGINSDDAFNFHEFSYQKSDIDEVMDACLSVPVFSEKKCVVVKDIEIGTVPKYDTDKLVELMQQIPEECVLIILQQSVQVDDKKSAKDKKMIKEVDKVGLVLKLSARNKNSTMRFIFDYVKKNNMIISESNAELLIYKSSNSFDILTLELDKLCAHDEDSGEILAETIEKLVIPGLDTSVFELSRSIGQQNYQKAMTILSRLEQLEEEPVMVFNVLSSIYVDMFRAKSAMEDGYGFDMINNSFSYNGRGFLIRNALSDARNVSWCFIAGALDILKETDFELKSGFPNGYIILEKAIARLFILKADGR